MSDTLTADWRRRTGEAEERLAQVEARLEDLYQATWEFLQALESAETARALRARERLDKVLLGI